MSSSARVPLFATSSFSSARLGLLRAHRTPPLQYQLAAVLVDPDIPSNSNFGQDVDLQFYID